MYDLGLINGNVYLSGGFDKKNIYINQVTGKIEEITEEKIDCKNEVDCKNKMVLPGFIDPHVHFKLNLGEFTSRDDFESGSIIAALGGVTTYIDFLDPIEYEDELTKGYIKRINEVNDSYVDYSFHVTLGDFKGDVKKLLKNTFDVGFPTIKVFTTYSDSDRMISKDVFKKLLEKIEYKNMMLMVHAESDDLIRTPWLLEDYEDSRPVEAEIQQIFEIAKTLRKYKSKVYIVHTTSGSSINTIKDQFNELLKDNLFFESCPQYFYLNNQKYRDKDGKLYLIAPPLRNEIEQRKLINNIDNITVIGTDHCSFKKEDKEKYNEVSKIPKGFGSIQDSFALMYNLFGKKIIDKFTVNPAKLFGLYPNKGTIEVNSDADIVIFNPNEEYIIDSGLSKSDYSPYEGIALKGRVQSTLLRGNFIVDEYQFIGKTAEGKLIRRKL